MVNNAVQSSKLVAYERVSTARQGRSGLGLEAQRKAIDDFAAGRCAEVLARFTEVESGGKDDRPELDKALQLARLTGATLVIAKLDRLSRNAAFLLTLQASSVRFVACDMPEANNLTVGIMALVAQQEREAISMRTKEALAAAKARGVKLGNPNGAAALKRAGKGGAALRAAVTSNANNHAVALAAVVADLQSEGHCTLRAIANGLSQRGMLTRQGGRWTVSNVANLLRRIERVGSSNESQILNFPANLNGRSALGKNRSEAL
jgi:DNA invertase Pin-like site-specific DNA recombinase